MIKYKIFVDNSPLVDRGSAYRAGLGFFERTIASLTKNWVLFSLSGKFFWIAKFYLPHLRLWQMAAKNVAGVLIPAPMALSVKDSA